MGNIPFSVATELQIQAGTPAAGFALQNATPAILSWTVPNDGKPHRFMIFTILNVITGEVGGEIDLDAPLPDDTPNSYLLYSGGKVAGQYISTAFALPCPSGGTISITQGSPLTGGEAVLWAEIWGA